VTRFDSGAPAGSDLLTIIRLTTAAEDGAPKLGGASAPVLTEAAAALPAIDAGPILTRAPAGRRAIPGFDGEDDEPFNIENLVRQVEDAGKAATRAWLDKGAAPRRRADVPAHAVDDPWCELAARRAEFAAAQQIQKTQAEALRRARDEIVGLDDQVKLLRAKLKQQEKETAAADKARQRAEDEKAALGAELAQGNANFVELLQQTADMKTAFEQREKEMAAVRKTVAALKAELAAKAGDTDLKAAIEDAKTRYYREFGKRFAQFEAQVQNMARMIGARDEHISTLEDENAMLSRRCEALATAVANLEAAKRNADEKLATQTATVTFLDSALQAERDLSGRKIAELTAEVQHERLARAADARESALVCKELAQLLPRLARQPGRVVDAIERAGRAAANDATGLRAKTASS
jgi:chromosome segregation ATPase